MRPLEWTELTKSNIGQHGWGEPEQRDQCWLPCQKCAWLQSWYQGSPGWLHRRSIVLVVQLTAYATAWMGANLEVQIVISLSFFHTSLGTYLPSSAGYGISVGAAGAAAGPWNALSSSQRVLAWSIIPWRSSACLPNTPRVSWGRRWITLQCFCRASRPSLGHPARSTCSHQWQDLLPYHPSTVSSVVSSSPTVSWGQVEPLILSSLNSIINIILILIWSWKIKRVLKLDTTFPQKQNWNILK